MSQASTPFATGQDYFMGNLSVVKLSGGQWIALKRECILNVGDLAEYKDDDINNVILNLRRPQDIFHPTVPVFPGSAEIPANNNANPLVLFQAAVARRERVVAWTEKQAPMVCGALSVKKIKLSADIVRYYAGIRQPLTQENMKYVILKDHNEHLKWVKALKKD